MNERILRLRKNLNLSRAAFGERLGVSGDVINNLERGRVPVKEPMIKLICSCYHVNEKWLETGEGGDDAMFNHTPESVFDKFLAMPPEGRQAVMDYALSVAKAVQGDVVTQSPPTYQDGDEEDYADIARRQRLSEKEQAAQVSSAKE